jgi:hypothetical protein
MGLIYAPSSDRSSDLLCAAQETFVAISNDEAGTSLVQGSTRKPFSFFRFCAEFGWTGAARRP